MSENQNWQEQLQQRAGDLIAQRLGNFAEELQTIQTALNGIRERLQNQSLAVTAEETAGLQECLNQARYAAIEEVENGFQSRLTEAVQQAREETAAQLRQEYEPKLQDLQAQLDTAHQASAMSSVSVAAAPHEAATAALAHPLRAALEDIDAQRQQADVLATLVQHAAHYTPRVVFFVIKGGNAIGWKATGFSNGLTDDTVRSLQLPLSANSVLHDAATALHTVAVHNAATGALGSYDFPVAHAVAVPLVIRGKAAAILYADSGAEGGAIQLDALESLMQVTSMAIELLPVRRNQPAAQPAVAAQPAPQPAPAPPSAPAPAPTFGFPPPAAEEAPAAVVTPIGAEVKEAIPATASATPPPAAQGDDEVRAHNDARRFARLLVSEIKLYNEQKVIEGRRAHDLYERLKEDVDRSRQMYEKRVSASVAAKFDYFYDEIVAHPGRRRPGQTRSRLPWPDGADQLASSQSRIRKLKARAGVEKTRGSSLFPVKNHRTQ
ncbi:MAG: hypothetical protein U0Y68_08690 [Blastocatellia bacterium]